MAQSNQKNKVNWWMIKAPLSLKPKLDEVRIERIKNNLDTEPKSYAELLDATTRFVPLWDILKKAKFVKKEET